MINAMLDGAYPPPDPAAGRVSIDQSEKEFQESVQWCAKELDEVQRRISELGGDMTILVVDPVEALGIDTMAAKPPAPPPVSPEDADFLFNPESLHKGGPVGRWRQPPGNDKGKEPE
jgi:hypothetical protein